MDLVRSNSLLSLPLPHLGSFPPSPIYPLFCLSGLFSHQVDVPFWLFDFLYVREVRVGDAKPTSPFPPLLLFPRAGVFFPLLERGIDEAEGTLVCMLTSHTCPCGRLCVQEYGYVVTGFLSVDSVYEAPGEHVLSFRLCDRWKQMDWP